MSVLVTGGAGFIGAHMAWALAERGEAFVVVDDLSTGFQAAIPPGATFYQGDVADADLIGGIIQKHGIDCIAHFAAKTVVPESVAQPLLYYGANTVKTHALISTAARHGVANFLFSSTAAIYGEPTDTAPLAEDAQIRPANPYGASKLMSERMLRDTESATEMRCGVLRYFNVAGADPAGRVGQSTKNATHLVKVAVQAALGLRTHIDVFGTDYPTRDGSCVRDYIHVSDLIAAHLLTLDHLRGGASEVLFNCGYGQGFSVLEVIEAVKAVSGKSFDVRYAPRRPGDPAAVVANASRIRDVLGWKPQFDDLQTIIRHALAWEQGLAR